MHKFKILDSLQKNTVVELKGCQVIDGTGEDKTITMLINDSSTSRSGGGK